MTFAFFVLPSDSSLMMSKNSSSTGCSAVFPLSWTPRVSKTSSKVWLAVNVFHLMLIPREDARDMKLAGGQLAPPTAPTTSGGSSLYLHVIITLRCKIRQAIQKEMKTTDPHIDIQSSCDGTWHRRGFSSKNGIVTGLSVSGRNSKV